MGNKITFDSGCKITLDSGCRLVHSAYNPILACYDIDNTPSGTTYPNYLIDGCSSSLDLQILSTGTTITQNGMAGKQCIEFDGVNGGGIYSDLGPLFQSSLWDTLTYTCWFYPNLDENTDKRCLVGNYHTSQYYSGLYMGMADNDDFIVYFGPASWLYYIRINNIINQNEWNFGAVTFNKYGELTAYMNGVKVGSLPTDGKSLWVDKMFPMIGCTQYELNVFSGKMSDIKIYKKEMSEDFLLNYYNKTKL